MGEPTAPRGAVEMPSAEEIFGSMSGVAFSSRAPLNALMDRAGMSRLTAESSAEDLRDALEALKGEVVAARLDVTDRATLVKLVRDRLAEQKIKNAGPLVKAALGDLVPNGKPETPASPALLLTDDEPASHAVDGAELLDDTAALIRRHVILSEHQADACALWTAGAHATDSLDRFAMLLFTSKVPESGKTTAATVMSGVVPRSIMVSSLTPAVLFRLIHAYHPTLIADEVDSWLSDEKSELRGVFNCAHWRSGAIVPRCVGDDNHIELFNVFGPKVIAMIGRPQTTMLSRCIVIALRRKMAGERVELLREDRFRADCTPLRQRWRRWALDHAQALRGYEPEMPADLPENRASDNWRALLSIGELAGGGWPERARIAALALSGVRLTDDEPVDVALLADVQTVFENASDPDYLSSDEIITALKALPERPWADWNKGRGISAAQVAHRLRDFDSGVLGLRTRETRVGPTKTAKRWHRDDFLDAWSRYLTSEAQQPQQPNETGPEPAISNPQQAGFVAGPENGVLPMFTGTVAAVAGSESTSAGKGENADDLDRF